MQSEQIVNKREFADLAEVAKFVVELKDVHGKNWDEIATILELFDVRSQKTKKKYSVGGVIGLYNRGLDEAGYQLMRKQEYDRRKAVIKIVEKKQITKSNQLVLPLAVSNNKKSDIVKILSLDSFNHEEKAEMIIRLYGKA